MTEYLRIRKLLIDDQPECLKILFAGTLDQLIMNYGNEVKSALSDLYYAVPSQSDDNDWWTDELRSAMERAEKLMPDYIDTVGNCANCGVEFHIHKNI